LILKNSFSFFAAPLVVLAVHAANASPKLMSLEQAKKTAVENNPELQSAQADLKSRNLSRRLALSPFVPNLSFDLGVREELFQAEQLEDSSGAFYYGIARWNLYNGGRDRAGLRLAALEVDRAQRNLELSQAKIEREVILHYTRVRFFDLILKIKDEALANNRELKTLARRKVQGGITTNAEIYEFDFREAELATEIQLVRHERDVAFRELGVALGVDPNQWQTLGVELTDTFQQIVSQKFNETTNTKSYLSGITLLEPQQDFLRSQIETRASLAEWLPRADVEARYGRMRFAEPEVEPEPAWRIEFRLSIPIFSGVETLAARQSALAKQIVAERRLREAELHLRNLHQDQADKAAILERLLKLQEQNIRRAKLYYDATLQEFRRGIKNSPDLSGASQRWFHSRERELELQRDQLLVSLGLLENTNLP